MTALRVKLKEEYEQYLKVPFPKSCDDDEVYEIWGEFMDYDDYTAGLITRVYGNASLEDFRLYYDGELEKKMREVLLRKSGDAAKCLCAYLQYMEVIKEMVNLAQQCLLQSKGERA